MAEKIIAITGGIASGKTAAGDFFVQLGRRLIDADVLARELVQPGQAALAEICTRFGPTVLQADGQLDRAVLRREIFANAESRRDLEAILHPRIRSELRRQAEAAPGPYALVAVPLLAEGGGRCSYPWLHRILVIDVPEAVQVARLMARDGSSREHAEAILAAQARRGARLTLADDVIVNDGPVASLQAAVERLDRRYASVPA